MSTDEGEEEVPVDKAALASGVKLKAGHKVRLLVGGLKAGATSGGGTSGGGDATGEGTGGGSGGAAGSTDATGAGSSAETGAGSAPAAEDATLEGATAAGSTAGPGTAPTPPPDVTPSSHGALDAAHFETDKAFPLPPAIPFFRGVTAFANAHTASALLVVGHTDAVGSDGHNLGLSDDRAKSVAAYLREEADAWMSFYSHPAASARWGVREDQHMLTALPFGGSPYLAGPVDGSAGPATKKALQRFQSDSGLPQTGKADAATRKALIAAYQAAEGTTIPAAMDLQTLACGARHLEVNTKAAETRNRRVDVFAFDLPASGGAPIKPAPAECRSGKHPGCKVYDRWKKAVVGPIPPGGDTPPPKPGVLEGTIVYRDGSAAAGVPVIAVLPDGSKKGAVTDASGHYRIEGVSGSAQLRLADGLPLAADPSRPGETLVAVNSTGGGGGPVVA